MAAISQTINNVLGGVSQQPDPVKLPGQVKEAVNAYLDPTFGCTKRPGSQFIGLLDNNIPLDAKWFPIFRDGNERYVACIYQDGGTPTIRCWNADTAAESTVTILGNAADYLEFNALDSIKTLTINDYTFIINSERTVSIDTATAAEVNNQALIVINSVAYNTTYAVDFLRDGDSLNQIETTRATRLSVTPASWEVAEVLAEDQGSCAFAHTESFVRNVNAGTGLGYTLQTTCNPTLVTTEVAGEFYPSGAQLAERRPSEVDYGLQSYAVKNVGFADSFARGSYAYISQSVTTPEGNLDLRIEVRANEAPFSSLSNNWEVSRVEIINYDNTNYSGGWRVGQQILLSVNLGNNFQSRPNSSPVPDGSTAGIKVEITAIRQGEPSFDYSYKSSYRTTVTLNSGGAGWAVGDQIATTMQGKDYVVTVEEVGIGFSYESEASASYTTPVDTSAGQLNVNAIVSSLTASIDGLTDYSAEPVGNVIVITRDDGRDFNIMTRGGAADSALYAIKNVVNDVSRLPAQCQAGFVLKVANSDQSDADDYFVKFESEGDIPGQGAWNETVQPGVATDLNASTLPQVLERTTDGNFELRPLTREYDDKNFWAPRDAGDEKTNPNPTFVGKRIQDAVFYMNRLGFLSDESIVLSQAGDYFNFFQGSAIAISDADPIDMGVSTTKPAKLKAAIGTPAGLLLFAENSQFLLKSQDVAFGPSTVKMDEITNYAYRSDVKPVETGVSILFPTSAATFTKVFELSVDSLNSRPLISENTRIVPEYIPPNLTWCHAVPNSSLVLMGTGDNRVYSFKFYNTGNERNLAGWTRWEFNADVKMVQFDHDTGFFVQRQADGDTTLSRMELLDDPETSPIKAAGSSFTPRLDNYVYESQTTITDIDAFTMRVRFPAGFYAGDQDVYVVATGDGVETFYTQAEIQTDVTGEYIEIQSNIKNTEFVVGIGYEFAVTLPTFFVKEGEGNRADRKNVPMIENIYLDLYLSGRYTVDIEKLGYRTQSVDLDIIRADIYLANAAAVSDFDTRAIPVFSRGDLATVTIKSPDPMPAALTSYSWEGHYATRGIARR